MTNNKIVANYNAELGHQSEPFVNRQDCQRINSIGVIVDDLDSYFTISALRGIKEFVAASGYELIVTHSQQSLEKEVANTRLLYESGVVGVIASLCIDIDNLNHFTRFTNLSIPTVFFNRVVENSESDQIIIDNALCGYQATEHLIREGCKRIAIVTSGTRKNDYRQRYKGYRAALEKYDTPFNRELQIFGRCDKDAGMYAVEQIRQLNPMPDGLFITNDLEAAMCMHALKEAGIRVPEDIAIVGFDNDPIGRLVFPALTTINNPGYEMGKAAALSLMVRLTNNRPMAESKTTVIPSGLIIRNSSLKKTKAMA